MAYIPKNNTLPPQTKLHSTEGVRVVEVGFFFLLYKEQAQNFISSLRLYACKNITMETPEELYDYFMQIPSELKEEITRELNQDVNTYLLPKVKQMARECAIKTLKRLSVGIKKNTIDPGKKHT